MYFIDSFIYYNKIIGFLIVKFDLYIEMEFGNFFTSLILSFLYGTSLKFLELINDSHAVK
jgi:hypothetical protein